MRIGLAFVCLIVMALHPANAEVRTIEETLRDRGFSSGIQLRSRQSSSVFFSLPSLSSISNLRLKIGGQIAAPSLFRGSLLVSVNGQPVDSFAVKPGDGIQTLQREIEIDRRLIAADGSMNLRFETEMLTGNDPCSNDFDPANVISIFPSTGITFDINLDAIQSLVDAVQLLPRHAQIVLPDQQPVSPAVAEAALHLAVVMIAHGTDPRIQTVRDDSIVAIRLESDPTGKGAAFLERKGRQLDIVIDPERDVVALTRLWQMAPGTILGTQATASRSPIPGEQARVTFREFSPLPPALAVRQTGEWTLNFPLLSADGRLAQSAVLKLATAPDWSNERPIASIYLNGQLVTAERLNVGTNDISFALPRQTLNFSNTLRVVVERANERRFCIPFTGGHAVQIMPDSGVTFGNETGAGFARLAHRLVSGGVVIFPKSAQSTDVIGRYILFTARILAAFGSNAEDIDVTFGAAPKSNDDRQKPEIVFETAGPEGLQIPVPARAERLNLQPIAASPLVRLSSELENNKLRVILSKEGELPIPPVLYLRGDGANALISASGVVWQDAIPIQPSMFDGIKTSASDIQQLLERYGLALFGGLAILIFLVMAGRQLLVLYFRGRAGR